MAKVFTDVPAPSTLGTFLRGNTFGHVRQLDAVASGADRLGRRRARDPRRADGTVIAGHRRHGQAGARRIQAGWPAGYTHVRGLQAQLATISTEKVAPVIVAARLRGGTATSAHEAVRLVRDGLTTTRRAGVTGEILVRADSAYCQHAFVTAVIKAGACFSVGARQDTAVRRAIAGIDDQAWVRIEYRIDPDTGELVSCGEVADVRYVAFISHRNKALPGRLIVRGSRNATRASSPPRRRRACCPWTRPRPRRAGVLSRHDTRPQTTGMRLRFETANHLESSPEQPQGEGRRGLL